MARSGRTGFDRESLNDIFLFFLAALLWGSFIGGSLRRGYARDKVRLSRVHAIIGAVVFTAPAVATLVTSPLTGRSLIIAGIAAIIGLVMGIRLGITTYWID